MATINDAMKVIQETYDKINTCYDASWDNIMEIKENSHGMSNAIFNGFTFGYAKGMKAAKSEMRRKVQ